MKSSKPIYDPLDAIKTIRGEKVILDADLAKLYGVSIGRFNEAVARNVSRFRQTFDFNLPIRNGKSSKRSIQLITLSAAVDKSYRGPIPNMELSWLQPSFEVNA